MSRRWLLILGLPLLLVALALGALALFRKEAVTWLLQQQLAEIGYPDARFTVDQVGLGSVTLLDVAAGPAKAARVEASFDPFEVASGKLQSARVVDLVVNVDLTGAGPVLPGLGQPAPMTNTGAPSAPSDGFVWSALPPLTLENATIVAETLLGPAQMKLDGDVAFASNEPTANFAMDASGPLGAVQGSLALRLEGRDVLDGAAVLESGHLDLPGGRVQGLAGEVDFRVGGSEPPRLRSELSLTAIEVKNRLFDTADLLVVLENGQFVAEGRLRSPDRKAEAAFKTTADRLLGEPIVATEATLKLEAGAALWPLLGLAQPQRGALHLRLKGDGTLQPVEALAAAKGGIPGWLAGGNTRGRVDIDLVDLGFAGAVSGLNGQATADWGLLQGIIVLGLPQDLRITAAAFDPAWLGAIGLPPDTAQALAAGATLEAPAEAVADPRIYLQPSAEGHLLDLAGTIKLETPGGARAAIAGVMTADLSPRLKIMALAIQGLAIQAQEIPADGHVIGSLKIGGDLEGDLEGLGGELGLQISLLRTEIGGYPVEDLAVNGSFRADLSRDNLALTLTEPGTISTSQVLQGEAGSPLLPEGSRGTVEATAVRVDWSGGFKVSHDSLFRLERQRLSFGKAEGAVPVTGDFGAIHLVGETTPAFDYVGTLDITGANIALPNYGLSLGQTSLHYIFAPPGESTPPADLVIGRGSVTTALGTVSGMSLTARMEDSATGTTLTGEGRGPGGQGRLQVSLTNDDTSGKGGVEVDWGPVAFKPGGAQPGALLDYFGDFKKFAGGLRVQLKFAWTDSSDSSLATITLSKAGFEHPQATVEGLDTRLTLNRLSRLSTPPNQKFSAALIDVGVPLRDVSGKLQLEAGKSTIYTLTDLAFTLFGGAWSMEKLRVDPRAATVQSYLKIEGLDLAELARELGVSDLELEGRMSGHLPFSYAPGDETVVVTGGRLTNTTPGAIRYGQPGTAELRSGGDENFALALEALENFQYTTFDLTIDKTADGKARLGVVLEGKNPAVLEGFPFRININLQTDLTQVLNALREGYRLNPDLFKGGWDFQ